MSFFGLSFGGGGEIDIILDDADTKKMAEVKDENGRKERFYLFYDGESVTGKVNVTLHRKTGKIEHNGIKIEFIGQIELYYDRGNHHEFLSLVKELARPGELTQNTSFDFEFNQVEKPYETYTGANVRLRYFLKVTIIRRLTDMTKELDIATHTLATYPEMNNPIKMEVGIEECLHIEFEYNKSKYHLKDVIVGKIYFLLVRIKIKHMEIAIIKRETTGSGPNTFHENETIAKYEIMDGAPVRGESIPIRVFLAGYDLTPTMRDINKKFSVRYYLNLVLVDEEERRYFKQQEITLWRKGERMRKLPLGNSLYQQQHALARHAAGDQPTQGVRTAPTPSQPPTPYTETEKPLPGEHQEQEEEEGDQGKEVTEEREDTPEDADLARDVANKCVIVSETDSVKSLGASNPPDLVSHVPASLPASSPEPKENDIEDKETDSLADLDIVAVGSGDGLESPPDNMTVPDNLEDEAGLESPPDMSASPEPGTVSPVISLPDAPSSEPGSPDLKAKKSSKEPVPVVESL